jgi:hypothetical protein
MAVDNGPGAVGLVDQQRVTVGYSGIGWGLGKVHRLFSRPRVAMTTDDHPVARQAERAGGRRSRELNGLGLDFAEIVVVARRNQLPLDLHHLG